MEVEITDMEGYSIFMDAYPATMNMGIIVPGDEAGILEKVSSQNDYLTISFRNKDFTPFSYTFQTWNFDGVRGKLEKPQIIIE